MGAYTSHTLDGAGGATELTHRERRVLFSKLLATLVLWIDTQPGWEVALDEGTINSPRKMRPGPGDDTVTARDGVHKPGSYHYLGLAQDLLLYISGKYVADGAHPAWRAISEKWESLDSLCTAGIRWRDSNHLSLCEGKREGPLP